MTPLTESELAEVAVALHNVGDVLPRRATSGRDRAVDALYAKIAALNEGADK